MLQAFGSTCPFLKDVTFNEDCWTLKDINLRSWNPELIMDISRELLTPDNLEPILAKLPNKCSMNVACSMISNIEISPC